MTVAVALSDEDLILWPDDMTGPTYCFANQLDAYLQFMSDDYKRIPVNSQEYEEFFS